MRQVDLRSERVEPRRRYGADDARRYFDDLEDWLDTVTADDRLEFDRILAVIGSPRRLPGGQTGLRIRRGSRLTYPAARRQLFRGTEGVFLRDATSQQALAWAAEQARLLGGTVVPEEVHGQGRPHLHIQLPDGRRSGHIFYGTPPGGVFFDYPY
jgi:hypothetical protein